MGASLPWLCAAITVAACLTPAAAHGQDTAAPSNTLTGVLSLYSLSPDAPGGTFPEANPYYTIRERAFRKVLGAALGDQLDYYSELLDRYHYPDPKHESEFEDYLVRKYADRMIKLLIADGPDEAALAGRIQARLPSQPPIVFVNRGTRPVPKSTGFTYRWEIKESLDLALRVHPDTRHVFVLCGASKLDGWYENIFHSQVPAPPPGVEFTFLRGYTMPALTERLATLPKHSIVFLVSISSVGDGRRFPTATITERLVAASNAPLYTWNELFSPGAFGGRWFSGELVATRASELALRVLRGERPEDIPITDIEVSVDVLDWRQLDRWNIREASVPAGVELRFREPGLFEQYRGYILGTVTLLLLQTSLIAGLLIQRRNRRLAENSLRESEERFRVMADTAPVMVWRSRADQLCDFFNQPWLAFRGRRMDDEMGEGWVEGLHPDDRQYVLATYTGAWPGRDTFRMEYRLRRADGAYRWVLDTGVPRFASDGTLLGYIGSCIDITERRQAEDALRQSHTEIEDLAGRLISAQEEERARIARDLHDDVSQQLAAISIAISGCKRLPGLQGGAALLEALTSVQGQTIALSEDIRLLSHDLHPGALERTDLVEALRSHCCEFARRRSISVVVEADEDLTIPDMTTALCLYRVVQEALHNIAKHAEARRVDVTMRRVQDEVQVAVADDGKGFDLATARERGGGLGLRSIEERIRLVGGRLSINTAPHQGTTITVWVKPHVSPTPEFASE